MALVIRKQSPLVWTHEKDGNPIILSKFYFRIRGDGVNETFEITEPNGVDQFTGGAETTLISDITLFDDSTGGGAETFASGILLSERLEALLYPGFNSASGGSGATISDVAYGVSWDGDTLNGASKNALYDKIETLVASTSPLTTKGDLYGFSTVNDRLPIGSNEQVLTADSGEILGVKWASPAPAPGAVLKTDYDANTILSANSDNTPLPITIGEQTLVGRITSGDIKGLSVAEIKTLLSYFEQEIDGTASEDLTLTGAENVSLTANADMYLKLTGNTTITFTDTPSVGNSIVRSYAVESTATETLGISNSTDEFGVYSADGTINEMIVKASNYSTEGLIIRVFFSQPN